MNLQNLQLQELSRFPTIRDRVNAFELEMRKQPQVELEVKHHFSNGVYARELHIPAGVILTGQIHKYENFNIVSKGRILVLIGEDIKEICAPYAFVSPPGTKRIAKVLEDTVWTTIHGTYETDLDKIENHFIAHSEQEYLEFCGQLRLLG